MLINGKVLVTRTSEGHICCTELYDPSTGAFAPTGEMARMANQFTATLIPDGTVLIAGGYQFGESLLYDPVAGRFSPAGNMGIFRRWHTATLLPDGAVLIAGGYDTTVPSPAMLGGPVSMDSAQLYTPTVLAPSPALFSLSGDGRGPGAILHAGTDQVVSSDNPAVAGEVLEIYGAGLVDGSVIPPQVAIGGRMAEVLFFGKAPGFGGQYQIIVRVPGGIASGPAVGVRLTYLGRPSNEVTISVL